MKITKIEVKNFRSIKDYSIDVEDFNIFVGQNNHGKTNLFEALSWFDSGKIDDNKDHHNNDLGNIVEVGVFFSGVQAALDKLGNERYKNTLKNKVADKDDIFVQKTSINNKREVFVDGISVGNPTGFDSALNYFLPKMEYVTTSTRLGDVSGYKAKSPIGEMLAGVLSDVVAHDEKYKKFIELFDELFNGEESVFRKQVTDLETRVESYLKKQFSEGASVDFKIDNPKLEDMLKGFETYVNDGIRTRADQKGDGMKRAIMLAIIQSYADYRKENDIARNFVFLIDEAELHLHPSAQRSLKNALRDIVENGGQVFVNTHSPIFANERFERHKIFTVQKTSGETKVHELVNEQEHLESIYQLLGGSPHDILLPRNFLIVEGQSEYEFIKKIVERFYTEEFRNIKIIFARGDHERAKDVYYAVGDAFTPLHTNGVYKKQTVILMDQPEKDKQASFEAFKVGHPWLENNGQLFVIPTDALEKYYPDPHKKDDNGIAILDRQIKGKVNYAKEVADAITKEEFESEMIIIYKAIKAVIKKAYS